MNQSINQSHLTNHRHGKYRNETIRSELESKRSSQCQARGKHAAGAERGKTHVRQFAIILVFVPDLLKHSMFALSGYSLWRELF